MHLHTCDSLSQYLLAHGNVDFPLVSRTLSTLDPISAFAPLQPLHDTDIEGQLRHSHEQTIISAIEDVRRATIDDFYANLERSMHRDWERQKEAVFDELGRHSVGALAGPSGSAPLRTSSSTSVVTGVVSSGGGLKRSLGSRDDNFESSSSSSHRRALAPGSQLQMHSRMMRYDRVTTQLNQHRKNGFAFGLASAYAQAGTSEADAADSVRVASCCAYESLLRYAS